MNFNKESRRTMYEDLGEITTQSKMYSNLTNVDYTVVNIFIPVFKKLIEDCEELELNNEQLKETIKFLNDSMNKTADQLDSIIVALEKK